MSLDLPAAARSSGRPAQPLPAPRGGTVLPRWPVSALFALYPVWWLLGVLDMVLIPLAFLMVLYLVRTPGVRGPRGFGVWLLFLLWMAFSAIQLSAFSELIGFTYRFLVYAGATVVFVYVYNARARLTARYVLGVLTVVWLTMVVGGYLGVLWPGAVVSTPMSYVVTAVKAAVPASAGLLNNELVQVMIYRRFAQYNPDSFFGVAPRPVAPFRFSNNWGNVYSLLLPLVVAYALQVAARRRFLLLWVAVPLSLVPAFLTLNRGMLLGLGLAALYIAFRLVRAGRPRALGWIGAGAAVAATVFLALPVQERIDTRLDKDGSSNETRASLYQQSLASVPESPFFGYGVPQESADPNTPDVGTQGQVWMILVSHGPVALACALGWLGLAVLQSRRRLDVTGLAAHTVVLVGTVELLYYGVLPYGLPLIMTAAALALRPPDPDPTQEPQEATL